MSATVAEPERQLIGDRVKRRTVGSADELAEPFQRHSRTASHMAQLDRSNPPSSVTAMWWGNPRSRVVKGTTMACRIGSVLNRSVDTTTHGRVARCSLATVGSSMTDQTCP